MGSKSQTANTLSGHQATDDTAAKLASEDALKILADAFEMDWNTVHAAEYGEAAKWPMGRTLWLVAFASAGLWAGIISLVRLV